MTDILGIRDVSYSNIIRKIYDVRINGKKTDEELIIAADIVKNQLDIFNDKVSSIGFFFWKEGQAVGKEIAVAGVDWAPNGKWEEAGVPGEYSTHKYAVIFNNT